MHSRRKFFEQIVTAGVLLGLKEATLAAAEDIYLERPLSGRPHVGKVLAAKGESLTVDQHIIEFV